MKFNVVPVGDPAYGQKQVSVVPSHPDGHFEYLDHFLNRPVHTSELRLLDGSKGRMSRRDMKKLQAGNASIMARYIQTVEGRSDCFGFAGASGVSAADDGLFVRFVREFPPPPEEDKLPAIETVRSDRWLRRRRYYHKDVLADDTASFVVQKDGLPQVSTAETAQQAVGLWWARLILNPVFDNGETGRIRPELPADVLQQYQSRIGGFASALARLSVERSINNIHVDYHPDPILADAADLADLPRTPATFSWKSYTHIENQMVFARAGRSATPQQVWPPAA